MLMTRRAAPAAPGGAARGEGSYLASASDLMIGLLFVFIILVVVLALEQRRQAIEIEAAKNELRGQADPRGKVTGTIGQAMLAAMPTVRIDPVTGVISLPEDVLFPIGRAELGAQGRAALRAAVDGLVEVLPCYVANQKVASGCAGNRAGHEIDTIYIEGHTDSRPMARGAYDNTSLSLDRARAVHAALVEQSPLSGYRNRLAQPLFSFSAYGDKRLLPGIDPTDARNRRVDLRIVLTYRTPSELEATLMKARAAEAAASR